MAICVDITSEGFKALKKQVKGLNSFQLQVVISDYIERFGRYPRLEELPNDSEGRFFNDIEKIENVEESIEIGKKNTRTNESVKLSEDTLKKKLEGSELVWEKKLVEQEEEKGKEIKEGDDPQVNTEPVYELVMKNSKNPLNTIANALSTNYPGLVFYNPRYDGESFTFDYYKLPNGFIEGEMTEAPKILESTLGDILDIIRNHFGITVNTITDFELASDKWKGIRPKDKVVKAFIYNNEIYVNTDHASVSDPIHEIFHIFIGALHSDTLAQSNELRRILDSLELTEEDYKTIEREKYTELDYKEELIVDNIAKYLTGQESIFSNEQNQELLDALSDGITKVLGLSKKLNIQDLVSKNHSIQSLMQKLGSHFGKPKNTMKTVGDEAIDIAFTHRLLNNKIQKVLRDNLVEVTQKCE